MAAGPVSRSLAARPTAAPRRISRTPSLRTCPQGRRHAATAASDVAAPASAHITPDEIARARAHCLALLRASDTPSSLLLPYIPVPARDAYLALRAFNVDIARTADATSTPTLGAMRLQFQREAVANALRGTPPPQPVAVLVAAAARDLEARTGRQRGWSRAWWTRLVDAREERLGDPPYPDLAALERYAEHTYSTLLYLTLQALPVTSLAADHIASHVGKASGIAAVLRGLPLVAFPAPRHASGHRGGVAGDVGPTRPGSVCLPLDVMAEAGVREEDVLRHGAAAHGLRDAVFAVATRANDHLITARQLLTAIREGRGEGHPFEHAGEEEHRLQQQERAALGGPAKESPTQEVERAFPALMAAIPTALWLQRLEQVDFDVFSPKLRVTDWRLPWRSWRGWRQRSI